MNNTPNSNRIHIGIYGNTNAGKSSLINALTNQDVSLVSDIKGTTTDPVKKAMEILPLGPCLFIDTAGLDDSSSLGSKRIDKTLDTLKSINVALIVVDASIGLSNKDNDFIKRLKDMKVPYLIVFNKIDLLKEDNLKKDFFGVSCKTKEGINALLNKMSEFNIKDDKMLITDLLNKNDIVILVTPIDSSAPKGRIILPQQQVLRELLDKGCITLVVKEFELEEAISTLVNKPKLVITDSQAFGYVNEVLDDSIALTSFSIIFARFKGDLDKLVEGANSLDEILKKDIPKVLISEGCTHHRSDDDIGTVKIPRWLKEINNNVVVDFTHTKTLDSNEITNYDLVIMCGGCMLNSKEVMSSIDFITKEYNTFVTNYGLFISYSRGILKKAIKFFET